MRLRSRCGSRPEVGLVEEQQRRLREQLEADADPLALSAGERGDSGALPVLESELADDRVDPAPALVRVDVRRKPDFGRVVQRLARRQLAVHEVLLGDVPDPPAQGTVARVETLMVVKDLSFIGHRRAGERIQQRRLPGPDGPTIAIIERDGSEKVTRSSRTAPPGRRTVKSRAANATSPVSTYSSRLAPISR